MRARGKLKRKNADKYLLELRFCCTFLFCDRVKSRIQMTQNDAYKLRLNHNMRLGLEALNIRISKY